MEGFAGASTAWRNRMAADLLLVAAVSSFFSFVYGIVSGRLGTPGVFVLEWWRILGYLVFAGLLILLSFRPRSYPGVWELLMVHKAGMVAASLSVYGDSYRDADLTVLVDGVLLAFISSAYILARGDLAWRRTGRRPEGLSRV